MRRAARSSLPILLALGLCLATACAWAYWSTSGSGNANATVSTLAAPTNVTAGTPGWGTSVPVSWTGVVSPNGGAVDGYYVRRFSGSTPSPACSSSPSSLLPAAPTSCTDSGVADGTYTYTVTAVFHSWTSTSAPSASVTVAALASFTVAAPASAAAGSAFTVTVTAKTGSGTTITAYRGTVHFTTTDPAGAVVPTDYAFVAGDNGVHTFTNGVTLKTGPSQTVTVNDTGSPTKTGSASVSVTAGSANRLAFTQQPGGGLYNVAWSTQPKITVQDAFGNTVTTSTASVTLAITTGTGTSGAALTCTNNPKAAVAGVVTFAGCRISKSGTGSTLTATASGLTSAVSSVFDVTPGPATKVVYTQQPTTEVAGVVISPTVTVTVQDAGSNVVTSSTAVVTIAISTNPGSGTLSGTLSVTAIDGVATFPDLWIDKTGTGYRLTASSSGLTSAVSSTFNVTAAAATQLVFTLQPSGGVYSAAWTTQPRITIQDTFANTVTTSTASVTLAITAGTGTAGATLTCTANPKAAAAGVDTFAGCRVNLPGSGYTLTATSAGLTSTTSNSFTVTPGPATKVVYTQQPTGIVAGTTISPSVTATIQDVGNNIVTTSSALVTVAIGTNPGGGTLSGTASLAAVNGVATFSALSINKAGTGYTLVASSSGLTSATSSAFTVTAAAATQLAFTQQPNGGARNVAWTTQPRVAVQDAFGNTVTASTASVTLAITAGTGTSGATLTCTSNPLSAVAGVATFASCRVSLAGSGYTLTATAAGLTSVTSGTFTIT